MRVASVMVLLLGVGAVVAETTPPKRILIIAGKKSHGPDGNGIHDYVWSARLLKVMLEHSNVRDRVEVEVATEGWPKEDRSIELADSIMIISDGRDGELYEEAPHLASPEHVEQISKRIEQGCGLVTFHFSTFAPDRYAEQILDWVGGYFDWETEGKRQWYSAIQVADTAVELARPEHPVSRGVHPFSLKEEFYFNLRFHPVTGGMTPILRVPALPGRDEEGKVVAWARERAGKGRGFGTTCGHFYDNWKNEDFRRLVLNGLIWSAGAEVPSEGVVARYFDRGEIASALEGVGGVERGKLDERPIRVLLLAGNEAHSWHNWKKTTPAIKTLLEQDKRIQVEVLHDPEVFGQGHLSDYQAILLNYCNWQDPKALSEPSRKGLVNYLESGGGLVAVHFANGAFHFSLPSAAGSDWPEYRRILRRVWDHEGKGESQSGHDAFGPFQVSVTSLPHPVTQGLAPFRVTDELYFRQAGDQPIEPLIVARSQVTGRDEPLAFAYGYGKGRVYQTLLGHSEKTYETFEPREMLRRAVAWVANRAVIPRARDFDAELFRRPTREGDALTEGRFGKGLDAKVASARIETFPVEPGRNWSVEAWARLDSARGFNVLLAHHPKSSVHHWELFTEPGSGNLILFAPGMSPDHVRTSRSLTDSQWHHLRVWMTGRDVTMEVDGEPLARLEVVDGPAQRLAGPLSIGALVEGGLGCDGVMDDIRLSRVDRSGDGLPSEPHPVDGETLACWRFDALSAERRIDDQSPARHSLELRDPVEVAKVDPAKTNPHFEEGSVGFRWREEDSADGRWNEADVGPFVASVLGVGDLPIVARGLSIQLDRESPAAVLYDLASGALVAGWTGGFLKFDSYRHGLISPPKIKGDICFALAPIENPARQHLGVHQVHDRVILEAQMASRRWLEEPMVVRIDGEAVFVRRFEWVNAGESLSLPIAAARDAAISEDGRTLRIPQGSMLAGPGARFEKDEQGLVRVRLAGEEGRRPIDLAIGGPAIRAETLLRAIEKLPRVSLAASIETQSRDPPPVVTTRIALAESNQAYVADILPLPTRNPHGSLCFPSGHDFLPSGDLAVSMVHGDVWVAAGVGQQEGEIRWQRFATGLHQPLGLRVIDKAIYVLGRDQITRLHDRNQDGRADYYENYFSGYECSVHGHDYNTCLETDAQGRLHFLSATQGLLRVRPDRSSVDVIATGMRNPNGLAIGPRDWITVSPQEGNWTPSSAILRIEPGKFYGYRPPEPKEPVPTTIDPPLCWIPRLLDNSSGGQVWTDATRFGPLNDRAIHFSYGQCRLLVLLTENVDDAWQGGVVPLPIEFRSGVMRGRVNPADGQLYVTGLKGWVSSAIDDGCLVRVRYTGLPLSMPISVETYRNGLAIRFTEPVEPTTASDPDRYSLSAWNYNVSEAYGSAEFRPSDPNTQGRDEWSIESATLLPDGKTLFLEIPSLSPVMQLSLEMRIESARKEPIETTLAYTLHHVPNRTFPETQMVRRPRPGDLPAEISRRVVPGVGLHVESGSDRDWVSARQLAWVVPPGMALGENVSPGPFRAETTGWIKAPRAGMYSLRWEGDGAGTLQVNDGTPHELSTAPWTEPLHKGFNRYTLRYATSAASSRSRLLWSSDLFAWEPVPSTALYQDSAAGDAPRGETRWRGRSLVSEHRCVRCHGDDMNQGLEGPDLIDVGSRLSPGWLADWIMDPTRTRASATMPALFRTDDPSDRQKVADLVAYLSTLGSRPIQPGARLESSPADGRLLYENLGCLACHVETPTDESEHGRLSLWEIGAKYPLESLRAYLADPAAHYSTTRMPSFSLKEEESAALALYLGTLRGKERGTTPESPSGDAHRGRALFRSTQCANCHRVDTEERRDVPVEKNLKEVNLALGCLGDDPMSKAPRFRWEAGEREAIREYLSHRRSMPASRSLLVESRHQFDRLQCSACHSRDGRSSPRSALFIEESERGLPPEPIPDLTWAGEKLRTGYVRSLLRGEASSRARPWLTARMPSFAHDADLLAEGLAAEFGWPATEDTSMPAVDAPLAATGEALTSLSTGLDCRQCHAVGQQQPLGDDQTRLALGINFALVKDRLRREHFLRFVLDPPRFDVTTRMPKLSPDGKTTKVRDVLDGDAGRQFEAIWEFIRSLP